MAVRYDTDTEEMEFTFCVMTDCGTELAKGEEAVRLKNEFSARNKIFADGIWREKWHEFCLNAHKNYINNFKEVFSTEDGWKKYNYVGHALDCEAHHDVITELFPTANSTNEI